MLEEHCKIEVVVQLNVQGFAVLLEVFIAFEKSTVSIFGEDVIVAEGQSSENSVGNSYTWNKIIQLSNNMKSQTLQSTKDKKVYLEI